MHLSSIYHTNLYDYLSSLCSLKNIMILGDFNSHDIDWLTFSSVTAKSELLCDFTLDNNLVQLIQEPTHVHGNILDLIFSNYNTSEFSNITIHPISDFRLQSDHNIITFVLAASPHSRQKSSHQNVCLTIVKLTGRT